MLVHSLFIESVDLFRLRRPSGGSNALGNRFDRCQFAPGEKKLGTLARKGACYSAADVPSRAVNYCYFVLQHHFRFLSSDELRAAAEGSCTWPHFSRPSTSASSEPSMM